MLTVEWFNEKIAQANLTPSTVKTYKYVFRRILRDFDEGDFFNPQTVLFYRLSLRNGTRNLFDATCAALRDFGVDVPPAIRRPMVVFPHPMAWDVMELGSLFGNHRLPDLTWGSVVNDIRVGEREREAIGRLHDWFVGDPSKITPDTPIVPKDADGINPMRLWMIEYIINSPTMAPERPMAASDTAELLGHLAGHLVRLRASAGCFRAMFNKAAKIGGHGKTFNFREVSRSIAEAPTLEALVKLVDDLPVDPDANVPQFW